MTEGQILKDSQKILKNEFRKEVRDPYAGIPEDELVTRDQAVLLKELRFHIEIKKADREHLEQAIEKGKEMRIELLAMPKSPYREECLRELDNFITNNLKKLGAFVPPRSMVVTLLTLEELFEQPTAKAIASELHEKEGPLINLPKAETVDVGDIPLGPAEEDASDSAEAPELSDE